MSMVLTFPGGKLRSVAIPATAGNVVRNISPGEGKRWVILSGIITLDTDATEANRQIRFQTLDGADVPLETSRTGAVAIVANTIKSVAFSKFVNMEATGGSIGSNVEYSWSAIIEGTDQFRITILLGQAGDSYSGVLRVLEFGS